MNKRTKQIADYGLLVALALVLSYLESLVPPFFAVPGVKLGLTNVVVLIALYRMGWKQAITMNFLRILLVSMTFGNAFSLFYAMGGGMLSSLVMIALKKSDKFSMTAVSVAGGVAHNVGQILVAMVVLETWRIVSYLVILWISGIAAGIVVGVISYEVLKRLPKSV